MKTTGHGCVWASRYTWAGQGRSCPPDSDGRIDDHNGIAYFCACQTTPSLPAAPWGPGPECHCPDGDGAEHLAGCPERLPSTTETLTLAGQSTQGRLI